MCVCVSALYKGIQTYSVCVSEGNLSLPLPYNLLPCLIYWATTRRVCLSSRVCVCVCFPSILGCVSLLGVRKGTGRRYWMCLCCILGYFPANEAPTLWSLESGHFLRYKLRICCRISFFTVCRYPFKLTSCSCIGKLPLLFVQTPLAAGVAVYFVFCKKQNSLLRQKHCIRCCIKTTYEWNLSQILIKRQQIWILCPDCYFMFNSLVIAEVRVSISLET